MKTIHKILLTILLIVALGLFFLLGKKMAGTDTKTIIVENTAMARQIADLAALQVNGSTTISIVNEAADKGEWNQFKDFFTANSLQVVVPYLVKYGIGISSGDIKITDKDSVLEISLPECKLLGLQLQLDRFDSMNTNGLFAKASIGSLSAVQKQIYTETLNQLNNNQYLKLQAQDHIQNIFKRYYKPLGYEVACKFAGE